MRESELDEMLSGLRQAGVDGQRIEVKASVERLPKSIAESLSAFSNTNGGTVLLGLEDGTFTPAEGFKAREVADALARCCADDLHPPVRADIEVATLAEGAKIVIAEVPVLEPRDKPCYLKARGKYAGSFIRTHDGDRKLSAYEIDRMVENQGQPKWDLEPVPEAGLGDLDATLVAEVLGRERSLHPRLFAKLTDEEALRRLRVLVLDDKGVLRPTIAGLMCLGEYPQQFFPRLTLTYAVYPGSTKASAQSGMRFVDSGTLAGPIPVLVADGLAAVVRNMRTAGVMKGAYRVDLPDYPPVAVREALTNALMHRDYSPLARGTQVQLNMYADRLEVLNPGGLFGTVTIASLGREGLSSARNEHLSRLLEVTPFPDGGYVAENRGSGYQEILNQLERELLPAPVPEDSPTRFALTFERRRLQPAELGMAGQSSAERMLEHLRRHHSATSRDLAAVTGLTLSGARRAISSLLEQGRIERTEPATSRRQRYRLAKE